MPIRFDTFTIDGKLNRTPEGFLRTDATATRAGVFRYRNLDGSERLELRADSEVFIEDSLNTLKMVPMTNDHPMVGRVTADNARSLQVGFTGENVRAEKPFVKVPVVVTDGKAVNDVEAGKVELSCGYFCDVVKEDGMYNGEKYTHKQTNIRYNHVAIVNKGRAGSDVKLKLDSFRTDSETDIAFRVDSEDEFCTDCKKKKTDCTCKSRKDSKNNNTSSKKEKRKMSIKKIDGIEYEGAQEIINRLDKLEAELIENNKKLATAEAARDAEKARADKAEAELKTLPQKIAEAATARRNLEAAASKVLAKDTKLDSMTDDQIKAAVIAARFPEVKLDGKSADYVSALFDQAIVAQPVNPYASNNQFMAGVAGQSGASSVKTDSAEIDPLDIIRNRR